jgi:mono/diheme cytochrome c family protein
MARISARLGAFAAMSACLVAAAPTWADSNKVASGMGRELAMHLCSACHVTEPGKTNPPDHVGGPAFQTVADRPDVTAKTLRNHLRKTHTNAMIPLAMPNPQLSEDELVKIIAYITSLRTTPKP